MSQVARELKMLFYLDDKLKHNKNWVKISELSDLLEITPRQVRRYRDDIEQAGFYIEEKRGPDGGYKLMEPLNNSLMISDNIMLALSISAKNNESLIKSLKELPVVPLTKRFGNLEGSTVGSILESSNVGANTTVSLSKSFRSSLLILDNLASV